MRPFTIVAAAACTLAACTITDDQPIAVWDNPPASKACLQVDEDTHAASVLTQLVSSTQVNDSIDITQVSATVTSGGHISGHALYERLLEPDGRPGTGVPLNGDSTVALVGMFPGGTIVTEVFLEPGVPSAVVGPIEVRWETGDGGMSGTWVSSTTTEVHRAGVECDPSDSD